MDFTASQDPQLSEALASLRGIVGKLKVDTSTNRAVVTGTPPIEHSLPPWDQVDALLKRAEGKRHYDVKIP